jgi:hypothetical protein
MIRYGRDYGERQVIGSLIVLQGEAFTVVGVMPSSFRYPTPDTFSPRSFERRANASSIRTPFSCACSAPALRWWRRNCETTHNKLNPLINYPF